MRTGREPFVRAALALIVSVAAIAFGTGAARPATTPTIYVTYTTGCTFTITTDGGIDITSTTAPGVAVPPGPYQVVVTQGYALAPGAPRCPPSTFELTGPGVSISEIVGEGAPDEQAGLILQPSATYVAVVVNQPAAQLVFTAAATGSSSSLIGPTTTTTAGVGQVQPGLVGSDVVPARGTLHAMVGASGKVALTDRGKSVVSIEAGSYEIAVDDETSRAGFTLRKLAGHAVAITGASFVGKRTEKVDLTAGTWTFYSKASRASRFAVVA